MSSSTATTLTPGTTPSRTAPLRPRTGLLHRRRGRGAAAAAGAIARRSPPLPGPRNPDLSPARCPQRATCSTKARSAIPGRTGTGSWRTVPRLRTMLPRRPWWSRWCRTRKRRSPLRSEPTRLRMGTSPCPSGSTTSTAGSGRVRYNPSARGPLPAFFSPVGRRPGNRIFMSYAIISLGGKQYRVREGERLLVDRLPTEDGKTFTRMCCSSAAAGRRSSPRRM